MKVYSILWYNDNRQYVNNETTFTTITMIYVYTSDNNHNNNITSADIGVKYKSMKCSCSKELPKIIKVYKLYICHYCPLL